MKAHILKPTESHIEGYARVDVTELTAGLSQFVDSECDQIFANDALDAIPGDKMYEAIKQIVAKLRLRGSVVVGGTDILMFCKNVVSGEIAVNEASNIISATESMNTATDVAQALTILGLTINSVTHTGVAHYEIKATRNG
jgi:hypothetical protein